MILRYYHTIKHLKAKQLFFQLYYKFRSLFRKFTGYKPSFTKYKCGQVLPFTEWIPAYESHNNNTFTFLNLSSSFDKINWDYSLYGKLWTYNLNYFDFLNQPSITKKDGLALMENFIPQLPFLKNANEPYPISLRTINWIKFICKHQISNKEIDQSLYSQYAILNNHIEYHLLGNHLLENAFSLYIGGRYFNDKYLINKGFNLIKQELKEQVLNDGGHFELSPMYHQIILTRLLDCYNFSNSTEHKTTFYHYAQKMLGWLQNITLKNGAIPLLNDSAKKIAPTSAQIFEYAKRLSIVPQNISLAQSSYRKWLLGDAELIMDVGKVGPDYIPGHAHADIFSFVFCDGEQEIIVDTGISTYQKNEIRDEERATKSHNTVEINALNQVDVWGGFRLGKRCNVKLITDNSNCLEAEHYGYQPVVHKRTWKKEGDTNSFSIHDTVDGNANKCFFYLHFHPSCQPVLHEKMITINGWKILFNGAKNVSLAPYLFSEEFNKRIEGVKATVNFDSSLVTSFERLK